MVPYFAGTVDCLFDFVLKEGIYVTCFGGTNNELFAFTNGCW